MIVASPDESYCVLYKYISKYEPPEFEIKRYNGRSGGSNERVCEITIENIHPQVLSGFINRGTKILVNKDDKSKCTILYKVKDVESELAQDSKYIKYAVVSNNKNTYQLHRGWDSEFRKRSSSPECTLGFQTIMKFMKDVICNGVVEYFQYLIKWISFLIQRPGKRTNICLFIYSNEKGTGKTTLSEIITKCLGDNYAYASSDMNAIFGRFNGAIADKTLITLQEAPSYSTNKQYEEKIKTMITDNKITTENKNKDIRSGPNCLNFIFSTNNLDALKINKGERRYFALECSSKRKGDVSYWSQLYKYIEMNEVISMFTDYMQTIDISDICNISDIAPKTELSIRMTNFNRDPYERFIEYFTDTYDPDTHGIDIHKGYFNIDGLYCNYKDWYSHNYSSSKIAAFKEFDMWFTSQKYERIESRKKVNGKSTRKHYIKIPEL